jgi:polar amino acid transport system substrate-binding protein
VSQRTVRALARPAAALACCLVAACSGPAPDEEPVPTQEVVERGALVVCTDMPYAPFVIGQEEGDATGFEIDLLRRMADGLDLDLEVRRTPYAAVVSGRALQDDLCDVAAGALPISDEGLEQMAFLTPHYRVALSLLVPTASEIDRLADLKGLSLAVQRGTDAQAYARRFAPEETAVVEMAGDQYMFDALRDGRVDAVLQEASLNLAHTQSGRFTVVEEQETGEQYAFAVRLEADQLRRRLDEQLAALRADGTYDELYARYFPER